MTRKSIRFILLLFAVLIGLGSFIYRIFNPSVKHAEPSFIPYIISGICFLLFLITFIKTFSNKIHYVFIFFKILVVSWIITITALNHFQADYAYSLIFVLFVLGFMFSNSLYFAIFYTYALIYIFTISFYYQAIGIEIITYLIITLLSGILIYFSLKNREINNLKLIKVQTNSNAILENTYGIFFFIDLNSNIISANKFIFEPYNRLINKEIIIGTSVYNYFPGIDTQLIKLHIDEALSKNVSKVEIELIDEKNEQSLWLYCVFVPVKNQNNQMLGISITGTDISLRKKTEIELSKQNIFFETLLNTITNPIFYKDKNGMYTGCNKSFEDYVGYPKEKIIGCTVHQIAPSTLSETYHQRDIELINNGGTQTYESQVKYADGTMHDVIFHKSVFKLQDGSNGGIVGIIVDITDRKQIEKALIASEERFREIADTLPLLIYEADEKGKVTYFNKIGYEITGYQQSDYEKGLNLLQMFPIEEKKRALSNSIKTLGGELLGANEFKLLRKDGTIIPVIINTVPIYQDGIIIGRRGVVTNITQQKEAEIKILNSLKEKEILLSEIHHRVKNNLQVIISMLHLQSKNISDPNTLGIFLEAQNRIKSMSLVHEKLYKAENFSRIKIKDYISDLIEELKKSYLRNNKNIVINCQIDDITINLDTSIPLGLIVNELITNSIKYAFPNNSGEINIFINMSLTGEYTLIVRDNGIGIDNFIDFDNTSSLGLRLVKMLSYQLNAVLSVNNKQGTTFKIVFQEYNGRE